MEEWGQRGDAASSRGIQTPSPPHHYPCPNKFSYTLVGPTPPWLGRGRPPAARARGRAQGLGACPRVTTPTTLGGGGPPVLSAGGSARDKGGGSVPGPEKLVPMATAEQAAAGGAGCQGAAGRGRGGGSLGRGGRRGAARWPRPPPRRAQPGRPEHPRPPYARGKLRRGAALGKGAPGHCATQPGGEARESQGVGAGARVLGGPRSAPHARGLSRSERSAQAAATPAPPRLPPTHDSGKLRPKAGQAPGGGCCPQRSRSQAARALVLGEGAAYVGREMSSGWRGWGTGAEW